MPLPEQYRRILSSEQVNALPIRRYEGDVRLVASRGEPERAMAEIRRESVLGFDTETRPAFRPGESYPPSLAQLAGGRAVYLFQLQRLDCSAALTEIVSSPAIVKAGVGLADDLMALRRMFRFEEQAMLDLGAAARRHGLKQSGVRALAALFLGFRIPKGTRTSNWAARRLSPRQVAYAATDAWACRELYLKFRELGLIA
ncbi:MAG: 3'-5' exonuclease [Burkholderiales bacterium]